jgi:hypothetical protein
MDEPADVDHPAGVRKRRAEGCSAEPRPPPTAGCATPHHVDALPARPAGNGRSWTTKALLSGAVRVGDGPELFFAGLCGHSSKTRRGDLSMVVPVPVRQSSGHLSQLRDGTSIVHGCRLLSTSFNRRRTFKSLQSESLGRGSRIALAVELHAQPCATLDHQWQCLAWRLRSLHFRNDRRGEHR